MPAQDAHLFTVGLFSTTPSSFELSRPTSTHSLTKIWYPRRRPLLEPQTRSPRASWSHHLQAHHLPHDSVEAVYHCTMHYHADASRTGNNTTASLVGSQVLLPESQLILLSSSSSSVRNVRPPQTMSGQNWPLTDTPTQNIEKSRRCRFIIKPRYSLGYRLTVAFNGLLTRIFPHTHTLLPPLQTTIGITNYRLLFPALPLSPSAAAVRNVQQLLRRQCRARLGRGHSNHRRSE